MPLDLNADNADILASVTTRNVEALKRRDSGWREKWSTDLSLLAGSPINTYKQPKLGGHGPLSPLENIVSGFFRTQIHKFTKESLRNSSHPMVSSMYSLFFGDFVGAWSTQMRKCANAQIKR